MMNAGVRRESESRKMKLRLIVNPTAGRGRAAARISGAVTYLESRGAEVDLAESRDRDHLVELSREPVNGEYDRVVACGGDGTLHWIVRSLDLATVTLAMLPLGSGDDFARVLGIPLDTRGACDVIVDGEVREIDVALANDIRYLGVAGLGFDSEVARYANENVKHLRGPLVYLYSVFRVLSRFEPRRVTIVEDGVPRDQEIMFAVVGNTRQYGGGIRIVPTAVPDDRQLDLCVIDRCSRWELLKALPLAYNGGHVKKKYVSIVRGESFGFRSDMALDVYADGELLTTTPVTIGLTDQRLRFVAPHSK